MQRRIILAFLVIAGCAAPTPAASPTLQASPLALPSLPSPVGRVTLLVDTDAAVDDLVAISFLANAPEVTIAAITVSGAGEAHCEHGVPIVLALLERLAAPDIPVACGRETPLGLNHSFPDVFRAGADAAGGLTLPQTARMPAAGQAVDLMRETIEAADRPLRILTLGPLTNLADALADDPGLAASIESVYVMGGAVDVPGNVAGSPDAPADNTAAEWNIYVDPTAAAMVLDAGIPVMFVSLDGTNQVPMRTAFVSRVRNEARAPGLEVLAELFDRNPFMTSSDYYLWDPTAAVCAAGYPVCSFAPVRLVVDVDEGPTSGATQRTDGQPNTSYLAEVEADKVEALLLGILNAE